jgi:hypothetical protein
MKHTLKPKTPEPFNVEVFLKKIKAVELQGAVCAIFVVGIADASGKPDLESSASYYNPVDAMNKANYIAEKLGKIPFVMFMRLYGNHGPVITQEWLDEAKENDAKATENARKTN